MNTKRAMFLVVIPAAVLLGGCVTTSQETLKEGFGDAVRTNAMAQTIDPMAGQRAVPASTLDGQRAEGALERYRKESPEAESDRLVTGVTTN